jgi:hypothetical protein
MWYKLDSSGSEMESVVGPWGHGNESSGSIKRSGNSQVDELLLASNEGLSSMEFIV